MNFLKCNKNIADWHSENPCLAFKREELLLGGNAISFAVNQSFLNKCSESQFDIYAELDTEYEFTPILVLVPNKNGEFKVFEKNIVPPGTRLFKTLFGYGNLDKINIVAAEKSFGDFCLGQDCYIFDLRFKSVVETLEEKNHG